MSAQQFVAAKDTILKEAYFKKRNFKGEVMKNYSRRWVVLTDRYLEWYDHPNGSRKNTIPLNHCYARIHEATGLIVGSWQTSKEWLLRDEGSSPAATAAEWLSSINKAIDNYKNIPGSGHATSVSGSGKGLVALQEHQTVAVQQTTAAPAVVAPVVAPAPMATVTTQQHLPGVPQIYASTPQYTPMATVAPPMVTVQQPIYQPPVTRTIVQQPAFVQPTYSPYVPPMQTTVYAQPAFVPAPVGYVQPQPTMTFVQQPGTFTTYGPPMY